MYGKLLLSLLLTHLFTTSSVADELALDGIQQYLLTAEHALGLRHVPTNTKQALAQKDVELKRSEYARALQLVFDGIESQKRLEKSRIDYEKSLIQACAGRIPIKKVMTEIKEMQRKISKWHAEQLVSKHARKTM